MKPKAMTRQRSAVKQDVLIKMLAISRYIIYFYMAVTLAEFALHVSDSTANGRQFALFNLIFFMFGVPYFILERAGKVVNVDEDEFGGWDKIIFAGVVPTAFVLFISQILIGFAIQFEKLAIEKLEIYVFYLSAAIAEETLMRVVLITLLKRVIPGPGKQQEMQALQQIQHLKPGIWNEIKDAFITLWRMITIVTLNALLFMLAHLYVYGDQPLLLLSAFIAGVILGAAYYITENFLVNVVAHLMNNAAAASTVVQNSVLSTMQFDAISAILSIALVTVITIVLLYTAKGRSRGRGTTRTKIKKPVKKQQASTRSRC